MKGQRLFVRPANEDDRGSIEDLYTLAGETLPAGAENLAGPVGRLAGTTVAFLAWTREGDSMMISDILVSFELRGLHIGRSLLLNALDLAADAGATKVRVAQDCKLASFFEHCGFVRTDGMLTKATRQTECAEPF